MCHPVSPSPNSELQPAGPHTNSQTISAIKKKSENEGVRTRSIPNLPPWARNCGGDCGGG